MSLFRDNSRKFDQRLRLISAVTDLPPAVEGLRDRLRDFQRHAGRPCLDRLAQAVIDGNEGADLDLLWAAAMSEVTSGAPDHNELVTAVRGRLHNEIRQEYANAAVPIYEAIAAKFDAAAAKLTAAHSMVDVESTAEAVIDRPEKDRKAWREAAGHAQTLSTLLPPLKAAAVLAGICSDADDDDLPLAVDCAPELHRRQLWAAWETEDTEAIAERAAANRNVFTPTEPATRSRCGRWSALLRLGATIRAAKPDEFTPYRRPRPLMERVENGPGGPRRFVIDPEDIEPAVSGAQA